MRAILIALLLATGCAEATRAIPTVPDGGNPIYAGNVYDARGHAIFRYTRSSVAEGARWTSIHRTFDTTTQALVVAQAARHDPSYALREYVEDHLQLGIRSVVYSPDPDHLQYTTQTGERIRHRSERIDAPAVTGPTLFGFVRAHWERLEGGETIEVRFVVAERRRSYAFELRMFAAEGGRTTVEMLPRSRMLRASMAPIRMHFEPRRRTILAYDGRIPPRKDRRPVDAHVEYRHRAAFR